MTAAWGNVLQAGRDLAVPPHCPVNGGWARASAHDSAALAGHARAGGADDPLPAIPRVVINEVLSASVLRQLDIIELLNLDGGARRALAIKMRGLFPLFQICRAIDLRRSAAGLD